MDLLTTTPSQIDSALAEINSRANAVVGAIERKKLRLSPQEIRSTGAFRAAELRAEIVVLENRLDDIREEGLPLDAEFMRRDGWTRFFIVQHLHTSLRCSSFRMKTQVSWLSEYSGTSELEMIEAAGDMVCTKCVPNAPTTPKRPTLPALAAEWDKAHGQKGTCPGAGRQLNRILPHRTGYAYGNNATCEECGERIGITSLGKIRKHKSN